MSEAGDRDSAGSPPAWGYESPSLLNREVSNILSRGQPPSEPDERHKWTHPSPGPVTKPHTSAARPVSCPLYPGPGSASAPPTASASKRFVTPSPVTPVSPFQVPDQSQELRNHLYQAAYQHHSPFRFPFLPVNPVNRFFQSLPASPLRLPYPFPYPYPPAYLPTDSAQARDSPTSQKRKHSSDESHSNGHSSHKSPASSSDAKEKARPEPQSIVRRSPMTTQQPSETNFSNNNNNNTISSPYFRAGSLIQLASGHMKKVEDLNTDDFVTSAASCPDISIDQARVARLEQSPESGLFTIVFSVTRGQEMVSVQVGGDHPFFVTEQGWSSCAPAATLASYALEAAQLCVGDLCISLRHTQPPEPDIRTKQVRFLDSPVPPSPVKKRRVSPDDLTTSRPSPVSLNVRVSHLDTDPSLSLTSSSQTKIPATSLTTK